jgi:hypothetical protein
MNSEFIEQSPHTKFPIVSRKLFHPLSRSSYMRITVTIAAAVVVLSLGACTQNSRADAAAAKESAAAATHDAGAAVTDTAKDANNAAAGAVDRANVAVDSAAARTDAAVTNAADSTAYAVHNAGATIKHAAGTPVRKARAAAEAARETH